MSDWNLGRIFRVAVSAVVSYYTGNWSYFASQAARESGNATASRQNRRALEAYNAGLKNRLEMVDLEPQAPRSLVLGRARYVEGVRNRWSSGEHGERLTLIVSFAGHEIDGFEQWYLDDSPVTLDADGWVVNAPYAAEVVDDSSFVSGMLDDFGNAVAVLPGTPASGRPVRAIWSGSTSGDSPAEGTLSVVVSGNTVTLSGGFALASYVVYYADQSTALSVRIRPFNGAPGQNVGAALAAEYPGHIAAQDAYAGIALAVVDLYYKPDVFPQGRPNITALMRGAKCFDPRTGLTAWTECPALHALHYATWAHGWALKPSDYVPADFVAAANVCDAPHQFTMRTAAGVASAVTLPLYRSGIVIPADADHAQAMGSIVEAMAGRDGWAGGVWRVRAGAMAAPVVTIDSSWLVSQVNAGRAEDAPVITAAQTVPRSRRINRVTGSCVDQSQRYQVLPFPAVQDSSLVAEFGPRPLEVEFQAVTHIAHAQHLAGVAVRQAHAGLRLELQCGEQASTLELLDVVQLSMPRYGYENKTFEVTGWRWAQGGAYRVRLAEISAAVFEPAAELVGRIAAPASSLRSPWDVEALGALTVTSGASAMQDGSIIARAQIEWPAVVGESVRNGGQVEVQYALAAAPDGLKWATWPEPGDATRATIPGLLAGRVYLFRARAVQTLPLVRGQWSPVVIHQIAAAPNITLSGLGLNTYRIVAAGYSASQAGTPPAVPGLYVNGVQAYVSSRSYRVAAIRRSDSLLTFEGAFDVFGDPAAPAAMAAALNALGPTHIVIVWTGDEPQNARSTAGLDLAMYRCGASRAVFGSPRFMGRAAYVLVGIAGCGEGNGAEAYQGSIDSDPYAWCDLAFGVVGGVLTGVSGTYTPRSLQDYGYTGALDATNTTLIADVQSAPTAQKGRPSGPHIYTQRLQLLVGVAYTNNSPVPVAVECSADCTATKTGGLGGVSVWAECGLSDRDGASIDGDIAAAMPSATAGYASKVSSVGLVVPPGATAYAQALLFINPQSGDITTALGKNCSAKIAVIT